MRIYFKLLLFLIISTGFIKPEENRPVRAKNGMVVSASRLASEVGVEILKKGGNAIDASVATGFALAVTYPAAGNLGGGGFMVIHTSQGDEVTLDFREIAPAKSFRDMYLDEKGNFNPDLSQKSMLSSGIPGSVDGLITALEKYGTLKLKDVIQPAIDLAKKGFILDYQLTGQINSYHEEFDKYPSSKKIFTDNGKLLQEGSLFIQKDLAKTLELIRDNGRDGFYKGKIAQKIVNQSKKWKGIITYKDLENYKPVFRKPVKGNFNGYEVVSMPPPSSCGIALLQALNAIENFNFPENSLHSFDYIYKICEVLKYVYSDRSKFLGDPDFYNVPVNKLISKEYGKLISREIIQSDYHAAKVKADNFNYIESENTTHYSVIDKWGNAVSVTTTLNSSFGNKIVVDGAGFLMNNEMDDFSAKPGVPNQYGLVGNEANSIAPYKRMLSSMTPTIILKESKPYLIIGSPGGSTIITTVLQVVLNTILHDMDIREAINSPRFHYQWLPDRIDYEKFSIVDDVWTKLEESGYKKGIVRVLGRAEGILIKNGYIWGTSDKRGFGAAIGY